MSAEIISFPIGKRIAKSKHTVAGVEVAPPKDGFDYLLLCKEFLVVEDYLDVLVAILDPEQYKEIEPELQNIVDCYYELEAQSHG